MSGRPPAISIAIRAYRRRWLGEAIASVLAQTRRDLELVVYDDAGNLEELVTAFDDPRVRYHRPARRSASTSGRFRDAVALCRGSFVGVLDDDDLYEPEFVERMARALEDDPAAGVAFCRVVYDLDGERQVPPDPRPAGVQEGLLGEIVAYRGFVQPSLMLMRREALAELQEANPIPDGVAPDAFVNVHLAAAGWRHVLVDEPLSVRRWHADQRSGSDLASIEETVATWERLALDGELEPVRRHVLARKLLWRAVYRLEAGEREGAREDVAAAERADAATWPIPRRLLGLASAVPLAGPFAARTALAAVRARRRRAGPPGPVRLDGAGGQVARDAASFAVGTVAAQVLLILVAPVLTRLYDPAELGAAAVIAGAMIVAGALACLRFDVAIPLAEDRREAAGLCALSLGVSIATAAALAVAAVTLGPPIVEFANVPEMEAWTWLVAAQAALAGVGLTAAGVLIRRRGYRDLAKVRFSQAAAQSGAQIGAGAAGAGAPGFAAGVAAGMAGYAAVAAAAARRGVPARAREAIAAIPTAARQWRSFAGWSAAGTSLHLGALALMPVLVAASYGAGAAGLFVLVQRVLGLPVSLAGEAVSSAWYGTAAEIVREHRPGLRRALASTTRGLVIGGGALLALVLLVGPPLFAELFGESWSEGGELLFALAPLHFAVLAAIPAGQALQALSRTGLLTAIAAARLAAGIGAILAADALGWSLTAALGLYAAGMAAISLANAALAWRLSA